MTLLLTLLLFQQYKQHRNLTFLTKERKKFQKGNLNSCSYIDKFGIEEEKIYHATDKGKRNIFLDVYNQDIDVNDIIEKAKKHISIKKNNDKIDSLIVVSGDKFHKIK